MAIKSIEAMSQDIQEVALAVKGNDAIETTHALVSENGVVYAYGTEDELKKFAIALDAVVSTMSV